MTRGSRYYLTLRNDRLTFHSELVIRVLLELLCVVHHHGHFHRAPSKVSKHFAQRYRSLLDTFAATQHGGDIEQEAVP